MTSCYTDYVSNNTDLRHIGLTYTNLKGADFRGKIMYPKTSFECADLRKAIFTGVHLVKPCFDSAKLDHALLDNANFIDARFKLASLKKASLKGAILHNANFEEASLNGADLTDVDLTGANLCGASLRRVNLTRVRGIGTKEGEIAFAKSTLRAIAEDKSKLDMNFRYLDETADWISGFILPDEPKPIQKASLLCPTLTQYFYSSIDEVMKALRLVATGKLSVFPD